jgi:hypothetical protein
MTEDRLLVEALDLAERILDALASAEPRWSAVEHMAEALAARGASTENRDQPP